VPEFVVPPSPPPHASTLPAMATRSATTPSRLRQLRRAGTPKSTRQARIAPPAAYQCAPGRLGWFIALLVDPDVVTVSVAVPAAVPEMLTGLLEPKLKVGNSEAPLWPEVMAAVSATLPVNPPDGVIVMVAVFPVVAPAVIETATPLTEKLGGDLRYLHQHRRRGDRRVVAIACVGRRDGVAAEG
jgi:hypothetical protein